MKSKNHRRMEVQFEHLQSAVELTHDWRQRVAKERGFLPPTAYHRLMLYLWCMHQSGMEYVPMYDAARMCGLRLNTLQRIAARMENELLVRMHTVEGKQTVYLTELGCLTIEI